MSNHNQMSVSVIGLGAMGAAMVDTYLDAGYATTVWNRSAGRVDALMRKGATRAGTVGEAVAANPLVLVCLFDHGSVHQVLDPVADRLAGRTVVNLTTGTPDQARELAQWSRRHGIRCVDGGMLATPPMIGRPGATILYGGAQDAFETVRPGAALRAWATAPG